MKINFIQIFLILFLGIFTSQIQAQSACSHPQHTLLMQNHQYAAEYQERQDRFDLVYQENMNAQRTQCSSPPIIPVAVHYQDLDPGYDEVCLIALARKQIQILNEVIGGYNDDISIWIDSTSSFFPEVNYGETCLALCLANQNHPIGYGLSDGSPAVTFNAFNGDTNTDWSNYINIFVQDLGTSFIGYTLSVGGVGNGDGLVINHSFFSSGIGCGEITTQDPINQGKSLIHLLGHYLNLEHIWGNGDCGSDDDVTDTPLAESFSSGCPSSISMSCGSNDMHMNIMDLTNDPCRYMFTEGQSIRMESYVAANLYHLTFSSPAYCDPSLDPTCTDGIQNGDETGIDCGGLLCEPCYLDIYVDKNATGANTGTDWANAFTDLQDALAISADDIIHIAEGTYLPTSTTARGASFEIPSGASLLGGYPSGGGARDFENYKTILSGNVDGIAGFSGNSYHVIKLVNVTDVILDGLDIKDGSADNASSFGRSRGGGIFANNASATISNTTLRRNKAVYGGAIFATLSPNFQLDNCTIKINTAGNGSAIYHSNQTSIFINKCYIVDNNSTIRCAIEVNNSSYTEISNTIIANNASQNANAIGFVATNRDQSCNILSSTILGENQNKNLISLQVGFNDVLDVNIVNSIIAHQDPSFSNTAIAFNNGTLNFNTSNCYIQGNNILGNTTDNIYEDNVGTVSYGTNYAPQYCAPTLHMGNDIYAYQLPTDFDGNPRIAGPAVDIGAHETQAPCSPMRKGIDADISIFPNPSSGMVYLRTDLEGLNIKVFDLLGKRVAQSATKEIDLSHLPLGIYIIKVENHRTIIKTEKLIKK